MLLGKPFVVTCFWGNVEVAGGLSSDVSGGEKKKSLMFSALLICATSVLLGISETSGKMLSKPITCFLSETKRTSD